MSTGWTWDYVLQEVDIPRLEALNAYWKEMPPPHIMLAARWGVLKPKDAEKPQDLSELMAIFPQEPTSGA